MTTTNHDRCISKILGATAGGKSLSWLGPCQPRLHQDFKDRWDKGYLSQRRLLWKKGWRASGVTNLDANILVLAVHRVNWLLCCQENLLRTLTL